MHQAAIRSLGIVEGKIREKDPETKSISRKENQKEKFRYNFAENEYSESSEEERRKKRKEDARGCKTYNSASSSKQITSCLEGREL
jgi:hypothetical protein